MDISKFDLDALQRLYISFNNVLDDYLKHYENELKKGKLFDFEIFGLENQINYYKENITKIAARIEEINNNNLRFSIEYIFWEFGLIKKSFQIHFIVTSDAYKRYGSYVTGIALFDETDVNNFIELRRNSVFSNSNGFIKFDEIVNNQMNKDLKEELKNIGFLASEISSISYL